MDIHICLYTYTHMCLKTLSERTPNELITELTSGVGFRGLGVYSRRVMSFIICHFVSLIYLSIYHQCLVKTFFFKPKQNKNKMPTKQTQIVIQT